jgi:sugar phosphate isomerase/epimerase
MNPRPELRNRRHFLFQTAAALSTTVICPSILALESSLPSGKPNSKVNGVQIGLNVPYSFGDLGMSGNEILQRCVHLGISGLELRTQPVELFLGAPKEWVNPPKTATKEEKAEATRRMAEWRKTAPVDRVAEFRRSYDDAGVRIEIDKVDGIFKMSDEELHYEFALAKALGGRAISTEISTSEAELKRLGSFADKHAMMIGYHGHATTRPEQWEKAFALARFNGANVDLGHFIAGNNGSPAEFLKKYHDRVSHVHVKDRTRNNGPNTVFGEGDTPIKEILQLIRDNKWKIQATIEFEYKVPEGSDRMREIAKCVAFCRAALA